MEEDNLGNTENQMVENTIESEASESGDIEVYHSVFGNTNLFSDIDCVITGDNIDHTDVKPVDVLTHSQDPLKCPVELSDSKRAKRKRRPSRPAGRKAYLMGNSYDRALVRTSIAHLHELPSMTGFMTMAKQSSILSKTSPYSLRTHLLRLMRTGKAYLYAERHLVDLLYHKIQYEEGILSNESVYRNLEFNLSEVIILDELKYQITGSASSASRVVTDITSSSTSGGVKTDGLPPSSQSQASSSQPTCADSISISDSDSAASSPTDVVENREDEPATFVENPEILGNSVIQTTEEYAVRKPTTNQIALASKFISPDLAARLSADRLEAMILEFASEDSSELDSENECGSMELSNENSAITEDMPKETVENSAGPSTPKRRGTSPTYQGKRRSGPSPNLVVWRELSQLALDNVDTFLKKKTMMQLINNHPILCNLSYQNVRSKLRTIAKGPYLYDTYGQRKEVATLKRKLKLMKK